MIKKINISGWSHEEWEADRQQRKTIGGSDAAAVLGLSKYASPYSLWAQKTGMVVPEDISDKEAVRLGNDLEQYVAARWMEESGKKCRKDPYIWTNTDYPFAHANLDRMVTGERAFLECKTTSSYDILQRCRAGDYPEMWYCQMLHYCMVTGFRKAYLGVLVFGHGFFCFELIPSEDEINALARAEADFFDHVMTLTAPPVDGSKASISAINSIYPDSSDGMQVDLSPVHTQIQIYTNLGRQIKELEAQQDAAKAAIQQYMGNAESGVFRGGKISWKTTERLTFDKKQFEADQGTIDQKYFKKSQSRTFKVTVKEN